MRRITDGGFGAGVRFSLNLNCKKPTILLKFYSFSHKIKTKFQKFALYSSIDAEFYVLSIGTIFFTFLCLDLAA